MSNKNGLSYIRIVNIRESLKQDLYNIAKNEEMQLGPWIRKKLKEIADSYPPEKKKAQDY